MENLLPFCLLLLTCYSLGIKNTFAGREALIKRLEQDVEDISLKLKEADDENKISETKINEVTGSQEEMDVENENGNLIKGDQQSDISETKIDALTGSQEEIDVDKNGNVIKGDQASDNPEGFTEADVNQQNNYQEDEAKYARSDTKRGVGVSVNLWQNPGSTNIHIPFVIGNSISSIPDRAKIMDWIGVLNSHIKCNSNAWKPKTESDQHYVKFVNGNGCSSYVGRVIQIYTDSNGNTYQPLTLTGTSDGLHCMFQGIVHHEMLHVMGFKHEQSRTDRDQYVKINWNNIPGGYNNNNFKIIDDMVTASDAIPYDYGSVMHYGEKAFAINKNVNTISPIQSGVTIGQRVGLSELDKEELNAVYKCFSGEDPIIVTSCEGEELNIECQTGQQIRILKANYGRDNDDTCGPTTAGTCPGAANSLTFVKNKCEDQETCKVLASNAGFGDPCIGVSKYLSVEYQCEFYTSWSEWSDCDVTCGNGKQERERTCTDPTGNKCYTSALKETKKCSKTRCPVISCEGSSMTISCPNSKRISVITAMYGRENEATCSSSGNNDICQSSTNSLTTVKNACENKQSCTVEVKNSEFGGDPCVGIYKYLRVEYDCLTPDPSEVFDCGKDGDACTGIRIRRNNNWLKNSACTDSYRVCPKLKSYNLCVNKDFGTTMESVCKKSCDTCTALEKESTYVTRYANKNAYLKFTLTKAFLHSKGLCSQQEIDSRFKQNYCLEIKYKRSAATSPMLQVYSVSRISGKNLWNFYKTPTNQTPVEITSKLSISIMCSNKYSLIYFKGRKNTSGTLELTRLTLTSGDCV